jgi:hypothetical protein
MRLLRATTAGRPSTTDRVLCPVREATVRLLHELGADLSRPNTDGATPTCERRLAVVGALLCSAI